MSVSKKLTSIMVIILVFTSGAYTQCLHSIDLSDTYGDGWNGGTVTVSVNGTPVLTDITMATATAGPENFTFMASTGDVINVIRTNDGSYPSEMRIEVFNGIGGSIIALQQPPTSPGVNGVGNCGAPMAYASSTTTQASTATVCPGSNNKEIIGVQVVVTGASSPLDLTQIRIRTNGSSAPLTDISNIDIYYTGTSSTYATTTLFGSAAPQNIGVDIDVVGTQTLVSGTNYFWVVYDVAPAATASNLLDARCTRITLGGINYMPSTTNPAGTRTITSSGPDCGFGGYDIGVVDCAGSPYTYSDNTTGANDDCSQRGGEDHMYTFTITVAADVTITNCDPTWDGYLYLYNITNSNCTSGAIASNDDSGCGSVITQASLSAGTYVVLIEGYSSGNSGAYDLTIDVSNCQNSGDDPCDAIGVTTACGAKTIGNNIGKTDSGESTPSCGSYTGGDVWYTTTVPASGKLNVALKSTIGGITDVGLIAYTATTCTGPFTQVGCDDSSMPSLNLTGLTPGATLFTRVWENNNNQTGTFEIEITNPDNLFCLTDDASMFNYPTDTCIQVTPNLNSQKGCAWYQNTLDFSQDFDHTLEVYCGSNDGGADGLTFTFHNDPQGTLECGNDGQYLGAGGIQNAVVVEVDTWDNGGSQELVEDHIAIWTSVSGEGSPIAGPVTATNPGGNIEDGTIHNLRITWNATSNLMEVYFDGSLRISVTNDFITNVFGSNNVFWGSTGSTGGASNQYYVCPPSALLSLPVTLTRYTSLCDEDNVELLWTTSTEINNDFYSIERSVDGVNFEEVDRVKGAGNSNQIVNYNWKDYNPIIGISYYRIKQTDYDGKYTYFELKSSNCKSEANISVYPNPFENKLIIQLYDEASFPLNIEIRDYLGRVVLRKYIETESQIVEIDIDNKFPLGTYFVQIINEFEHYTQKVIKIK